MNHKDIKDDSTESLWNHRKITFFVKEGKIADRKRAFSNPETERDREEIVERVVADWEMKEMGNTNG